MKLTQMQLFRFWFVYLITAPLAFLLGPLYDIGEFEGWMALILSSGLSLLCVYGAVRAARLKPDQDWASWGSRVMGRGVHSVILFIVSAACVLLISLNLTNYIDLFGSVYLPGTPDLLIGGLFMFCTYMAARSGLKTIVYLSEGFFLTAVVAALLILPFLSGQLNYKMNIALVTHWDMTQLWKSVLFCFTWFGEMSLVFLMLPQFKLEKPMKYLAYANIGACFLVLLYWYVTILLFGPHFGSHLRFPLMETIRFIVVSQLVENLDPVLLSIWTTSFLVKSALLLHISSRLTARLFGVDNYRPFTFMLGSLGVVFAIRFVHFPGEFGQFVNSPAFVGSIFLVECIPLLYWFIGHLRRKNLT